MNFTLYNSNETEFKTNGKGVFNKATSIFETHQLNGEYSIEIRYPASDKKAKLIQQYNIIKIDNQLFRIQDVTYDSVTKVYQIYAPHIFYDLKCFFIEDVRPTNLSISDACNWINSHIESPTPFNFHGDDETRMTIYLQNKSFLQGFWEMIERVGDKYEILRDNYSVGIMKSIDRDKHVLATDRKNISGITVSSSTDEICTRILPQGYNGLKLPELYVLADLDKNVEYPQYHITQKIKFENVIDDITLRKRAQELAKFIGKPRRNVSIDFVDLSKTDLYQELSHLQSVEVGDKVIVRYEDIVNEEMKVIRIKKDKLTNKADIIELDAFKSDINREINKILNIDKRLETIEEGQVINNLVWNSSFERFNATTKAPLHWSGGKSVEFHKHSGNYCCLLETSEMLFTPDEDDNGNKVQPNVSAFEVKEGQFSFSKKGGVCQLQLFNAETLEPISLLLPNLTTNTYFNTPKTEDFSVGTYLIKFNTEGVNKIMIKFTNIDAAGNRVFLDCIQLEQGRDSQINYTDGINSTPFANYLSDMWLETVDLSISPVINITFSKRYVKMPQLTITADKSLYSSVDYKFVILEDEVYGRYYSGVDVYFRDYVEDEEKIDDCNITMIGKGE